MIKANTFLSLKILILILVFVAIFGFFSSKVFELYFSILGIILILNFSLNTNKLLSNSILFLSMLIWLPIGLKVNFDLFGLAAPFLFSSLTLTLREKKEKIIWGIFAIVLFFEMVALDIQVSTAFLYIFIGIIVPMVRENCK
ncbi:hypothetical protein BG95_04245 [Thermosipho sp. 1063]|uniref:hypothetical protein n=1 Tax=unclassified Thermosipho (in: thermotogales) TaxID=2676525 RepID=UPI0009492587|nr:MULTISPECIES: hypothetical protein [unclassified Thermosipho (in: thermotogales)]ANQ54619.1 hypothetical protein Y592_04315 [Thermosipho sp. 1070]APT73034.1 hypothetical protein BG95_04245 [Thermosipho sp. 1063]OOC44227.1 hypothetical protein XO08_04135 [Thermosipho sp. 1074]